MELSTSSCKRRIIILTVKIFAKLAQLRLQANSLSASALWGFKPADSTVTHSVSHRLLLSRPTHSVAAAAAALLQPSVKLQPWASPRHLVRLLPLVVPTLLDSRLPWAATLASDRLRLLVQNPVRLDSLRRSDRAAHSHRQRPRVVVLVRPLPWVRSPAPLAQQACNLPSRADLVNLLSPVVSASLLPWARSPTLSRLLHLAHLPVPSAPSPTITTLRTTRLLRAGAAPSVLSAALPRTIMLAASETLYRRTPTHSASPSKLPAMRSLWTRHLRRLSIHLPMQEIPTLHLTPSASQHNQRRRQTPSHRLRPHQHLSAHQRCNNNSSSSSPQRHQHLLRVFPTLMAPTPPDHTPITTATRPRAPLANFSAGTESQSPTNKSTMGKSPASRISTAHGLRFGSPTDLLLTTRTLSLQAPIQTRKRHCTTNSSTLASSSLLPLAAAAFLCMLRCERCVLGTSEGLPGKTLEVLCHDTGT